MVQGFDKLGTRVEELKTCNLKALLGASSAPWMVQGLGFRVLGFRV